MITQKQTRQPLDIDCRVLSNVFSGELHCKQPFKALQAQQRRDFAAKLFQPPGEGHFSAVDKNLQGLCIFQNVKRPQPGNLIPYGIACHV